MPIALGASSYWPAAHMFPQHQLLLLRVQCVVRTCEQYDEVLALQQPISQDVRVNPAARTPRGWRHATAEGDHISQYWEKFFHAIHNHHWPVCQRSPVQLVPCQNHVTKAFPPLDRFLPRLSRVRARSARAPTPECPRTSSLSPTISSCLASSLPSSLSLRPLD